MDTDNNGIFGSKLINYLLDQQIIGTPLYVDPFGGIGDLELWRLFDKQNIDFTTEDYIFAQTNET